MPRVPRASRLAVAAVIAAALCSQQLIAASDANAETVTVTDWDSLKAAFLAGEDIVLGADIDRSNTNDGHLAVGDGTAVDLDLNGHFLYVYGTDGNVAGITVPATPDTSLTIGDSSPDNNGQLSAYGAGSAGIGGDANNSGGNVTITGGNVYAGSDTGAGIGSGPVDNGATDVDGGSLTVTGGYVQAQSGSYGPAAIGGGTCADGGELTVSGGEVDVVGGSYAAAIGSGAGWCSGATSGGTVDVSGGTVNATNSYSGAAIGGGYNGSAADVTVSGGTVNAYNYNYNDEVGIGNGPTYSGPVAGSLDVTGGYVGVATYNRPGLAIGGVDGSPGIPVHIGPGGTLTATYGDSIGGGTTAQDWGSLTNEGTLTLDFSTLTVPAGVTVHNSGRINMGGGLSGAGTVDNTGVIVPIYTAYSYGGSVANNGQGAPGITIAKNSYQFTFDPNGGPDSAPGNAAVFGPTISSVGQGLPGSTAPAGTAFKGWFTAPTGGTQVTGSTDLNPLVGSGPRMVPLYAHYNRAQNITFSSTAPTSAHVDDTYALSATGGTSGQPVQFSVAAGTTNNSCTLTGSTVTFRHVGTCVVAADEAGVTDTYDAAPTQYQSISVAQAAQLVTFSSTAPTSAMVGDAAYTVTASGGSSAQPVVFSRGAATTNNACTVSGSTVTIDHPGVCAVNADQAGTADYAAAARQVQTFSIGKGNQTITYGTSAPTTAQRRGTTYTPTASSSANLPVAITVDPATTNGACVVDAGVVSFPHSGQCVLAADQAGTGDRNAAPTQLQSFAVAGTPQPINYTSDAPNDAVVGGNAYVPTAQGGASNNPVALTVDSATTNSACSIDNGSVTFQHVGICVLAASQPGDTDYASGVQLQTFSVGKGGQTVAFTSFGTNAALDGTESLHATGDYSGNDVTFSVDSGTTTNAACTLAGTLVTYHHAGICSITAHQLGNADYLDAAPVTRSATVGKAVQAITPTSTTPTTATVDGNYTPTGTSLGGPVSFSTDGNACSLHGGIVSFDHAGSCTVNFDQIGSADYDAAPRVSQTFAVSPVVSTVVVTTDPTRTVHGQLAYATASVTAAHGTPAGTVQFSVDGIAFGAPVSVGDGTATSPALVAAGGHALSAAAHVIGADFTPSDTDHAGATGVASHVVDRALSASTITITAGRPTATVIAVAPGAGTPTGTVTFTVGGKMFGTASIVDGAAALDRKVPTGTSQQVAATYPGDDAFTGSSASTGRSNPSLTATVTGSPARNSSGWYRGSVTVRFHCTANGAPLRRPCPAPATLRREGAGQSVTRTVLAIDGGAKTVVVRGIDIDHTAPAVAIRGARTSAVYRGNAPRVRCAGTDRLSGVASCTLVQRSTATTLGRVVQYTATATDRAGNRRVSTGSYTVLTRYVDGAVYRAGAFDIQAGRTYTLVVTGSSTPPAYYNAEVAPRHPASRGSAFHFAGKQRWTLAVTVDKRMRTHEYWNAGVKIGRTIHVLRLRVA